MNRALPIFFICCCTCQVFGNEATIDVRSREILAGGNVNMGTVTNTQNFTSVVTGGIVIYQTDRVKKSDSDIAKADDVNFVENVQKSLIFYERLLNESNEKNIVLLLGRTGAGKSTLINYLCKKALEVNDLNDIVLKDSTDLEAAAIGTKSESETQCPKALVTESNDLLFDIPGIASTGNTSSHLMDSIFIREIVLRASAVKFIFVIGEEEFISDKSKCVSDFFEKMKTMFDIDFDKILKFSVIVLTKWTKKRAQPLSFCKEKLAPVDFDLINKWFSLNRVFLFDRPSSDRIDQGQRDPIITTFRLLNAEKILTCDTSHIFSYTREEKIKNLFGFLLEKDFKYIYREPEDDIALMRKFVDIPNDEHFEFFKKKFDDSLVNSTLISYAKDIYLEVFAAFKMKKKQT